MRDKKAPFCASAERYCFAYLCHGVNACENCPYGGTLITEKIGFRTALEILREKRK